nr:zinc finger, CCHC-type [Tanacetum cinerariifolium]
MMGDVSDQKVPILGLTITRILNQEKSPDLLPHQGLEAFQPSAECPRMIINGKNTPLLDGKEVNGPPVNMTEEGKNKNSKQNKRKKLGFKENNIGSSSNKKAKLECWKCGKTGHFKRDFRSGNKKNINTGGSEKGSKDHSQDQNQNLVDTIAWWIDSDATTHVCKDRCWFKSYEPVKDGSVLYMGDDHFAHVHGKGSVVYESDKYILSKSGVFLGFGYYNNGMFMLNLNKVPDDSDYVYMSSSTVVNSSLWHARLGQVHYKRIFKMFRDDLILVIDENLEKYTTCRVPNKRNKTTPYELWYKKRPNMSFLRVWGCRTVVRLPDPKRKTLGEKGIDCMFVGYAEHSKAYIFYIIEPNESISINSIIESKDAIFDKNRLSLIPRPNDIIPNSVESQRDDHSDDVPSENPEPRKEEDPRTYNEAMQSQDAAFWKEAIDDEIGFIIENNTWVLSDLPLGCKPLGCKWIFKRKMKVDETIDKLRARLVIQGFRQKEGIDYFDAYAPVARITTIRLLLALVAIHNLVIHQTDVKTTFLNGDLEKKAYMKQPEGFIMPGHEHKVCKLVKSLYELKQAPKQWHQKFDEIVLSSGFLLNQSNKCVYSKFDSSGKGIIICLYVDDMLIFKTDQNQVDKTKFLSSRFSMKNMGEADDILGIKIKRENKGILITQSHYIEKILKKFNREDCHPVSTPMDLVEKLKPNTGKPVDQLEYSRAIDCLMYAMTSTRLDISYVVGRSSRFPSNPSRQYRYAITRVFKYLKGTMNYGLSYIRYSSVLEAYLNASWINHVEDSSSLSGWVFLLKGGAISWASNKQTCITSSTIEYEFVALAAAGKEADWLRNLIHEILKWPKPIAPIFIRCDSAATLTKAYSQIYNGKSRHLSVRHRIKELKTYSDVQDLLGLGMKTNGLLIYYSSDEIKEFDNVDFHTKGEENVVIKNLTTHDLFLNKLCGNNEMFRDYLDESVPETVGEALDDSDDTHIDPIHKVQKGVTYPKHNLTVPWNKMTHVLGMRYEHLEQLKQALASYGVANGYQLWYARNDYRSLLVYCGRCVEGESSKSAESTPKSSKKGAKSNKSDVCGFRLRASWMHNEHSFQIKSLHDDHKCFRNYKLGSLVTYKWIAYHFSKDIINDPFIPSVKPASSVPASDNVTKKKGKRTRSKPDVPFRIYHKNRGRYDEAMIDREICNNRLLEGVFYVAWWSIWNLKGTALFLTTFLQDDMRLG